jgi:hypothetical protein
MDDRHGDTDAFRGEIYYKRWSKSNGSWGNEERLTNDPADSRNPSIAADINGNIHVVWMDNVEIYYKKRDSNQWGEEIKIADDNRRLPKFPIVATGPDGDVHIVWQDRRDGNYEIYYRQWNETSTPQWGPITRLTDDDAGSIYPSLAVDSDGNVHVVWEDYRDGAPEIYYTHWNGVNGVPWEEERLTNAAKRSRYPSVAVDSDNNVHVAFEDSRDGKWDSNIGQFGDWDNYEIYYKRKQGQSWSEDLRLTIDSPENPEHSRIPSIATDSMNNVHVVWFDRRFGHFLEVFYKRWSSSEGKWEDELYRDDSIYSGYASVATDLDGNVHIVFEDARAGTGALEIYYQKYLAR